MIACQCTTVIYRFWNVREYSHTSYGLHEYMHSLIIKGSNRQYSLYSETLVFRTSEMRTSRFNGRFALVQIEFPLTAIHYKPWNANNPQFCKADKFLDIHWIIQTLTCLSHKFVCHSWPIQQLDIIIALVCIVLASFLTSVQQGRALEHAFVALNSMGMHCHT